MDAKFDSRMLSLPPEASYSRHAGSWDCSQTEPAHLLAHLPLILVVLQSTPWLSIVYGLHILHKHNFGAIFYLILKLFSLIIDVLFHSS